MRIFGKKWLATVLACLAVGLLVACGNDAENIPAEPATEAVQEEVSMSEMSEVEAEEVSEEVSEETGGVEYFNFANKAELMTYLEELNQTTVLWYNFSLGTEQAIIPNDEKYILAGDDCLMVISTNKDIVDVKENVDYIDAVKAESKENQWGVFVETTGTDLEVSFTVVYEDGTEEDFTIYITKGGEESGDISQEEIGGVEYTNYSSYAELMTYLETLNQTVIVDYNFSEGTEQAIISNGGKYTLEGDENDNVRVISTNKSISEVRSNVDYVHATEDKTSENDWMVFIDTTSTDLEVSFTVMYEDGTEEDFTIYVTKE